MRAIIISLAALLALAATACGGVSGRAAWPDVASTDRSADDLGLPTAEQRDDVTADEGASEEAAPAPEVPAAS